MNVFIPPKIAMITNLAQLIHVTKNLDVFTNSILNALQIQSVIMILIANNGKPVKISIINAKKHTVINIEEFALLNLLLKIVLLLTVKEHVKEEMLVKLQLVLLMEEEHTVQDNLLFVMTKKIAQLIHAITILDVSSNIKLAKFVNQIAIVIIMQIVKTMK
jgi:hypothetical protein